MFTNNQNLPTEGPLRTLSAIVLDDLAMTVWVGKNRVGKGGGGAAMLTHGDKAVWD